VPHRLLRSPQSSSVANNAAPEETQQPYVQASGFRNARWVSHKPGLRPGGS